MPTHGNPGSSVIATIGLGLIFDSPGHIPPDGYLPEAVQCRKCRNVFDAEAVDRLEAADAGVEA
jgi:hypothetical protein